MLCGVCVQMLRGRRKSDQVSGGTPGLHLTHHDSAESLWQSVSVDCSICRALADGMTAKLFEHFKTKSTSNRRNQHSAGLRSLAHLSAKESSETTVYRLDFSVKWEGASIERTFILKPMDDVSSSFRTPTSTSMSNPEVFDLAQTWMKKCQCAKDIKPREKDYPTRLLDLADLKKRGHLEVGADSWTYIGSLNSDSLKNTKIRVVEASSIDWANVDHRPHLYVTLSHKWGDAMNIKLTEYTKKVFEEGLTLKHLPQTFQDAILLAARLPKVGFIWIDSLCIIQEGDDGVDWRQESARMQDVYRNAFLNISATAADSSDEGLYSHRVPHDLWEEIVSLNIDRLSSKEHRFRRDNGAVGPVPNEYYAVIRSCVLVDVSLWETLVNQAPVNRRGWVVQERLLARRILHFCQGRIAWECCEFEEIEGRSTGIPKYEFIGDELVIGVPMKALGLEHGRRLRQNNLRGGSEPLESLRNKPEAEKVEAEKIIHALEIWARIVSMYSTTKLTKASDKLIALSGMANHMKGIIGSEEDPKKPAQYVAGLWRPHLLSQLLWKVDPLWRAHADSVGFLVPHDGLGTFEYPSTRPQFTAPSFSWASIDTQHGNGITYGEVLDEKHILVQISKEKNSVDTEEFEVSKIARHNNLGQLQGPMGRRGHIVVWGWMLKVKLKGPFPQYSWKLPEVYGKHAEVYMDCPAHDNKGNRLVDSDSIYCLPMAIGPPSVTVEFKDLICLLLEEVPAGDPVSGREDQVSFRRVGLTKLSPLFEKDVMKSILRVMAGDQDQQLEHKLDTAIRKGSEWRWVRLV